MCPCFPLNIAKRENGADTWTTTMAAQQRFTADQLGHDWARRVSDVVLRLSWLSPGQYGHGAEMVAEIGRLLGGWQKASLR